MPTPFLVRTKKTHCIMGLFIGAAFLFLGLDLHLFHFIKGWKISSDHALWIVFSFLGTLALLGSIRRLLWPETFLVADDRGITLFSGGSARERDAQTRSWNVTRRKGDRCLIPWPLVRQVGVGRIATRTRTTSTGGTFEWGGGQVIVGGRKRQETAPALEVLCDASVRLSGFSRFGVSHAWNGLPPEELAQVPEADRQNLRAEDLCSGFVVHHRYLSGGLDRAIAILEQWRKRADKVEP